MILGTILLLMIVIIGGAFLLISIIATPARAAGNEYELQMRQIKALEAIAAAQCFARVNMNGNHVLYQCRPYLPPP